MKRITSTSIGSSFRRSRLRYRVSAGVSPATRSSGGASGRGSSGRSSRSSSPRASASRYDEHADEVKAFHRMLKMDHRMWRRLKQNPEVV